MGIRNRASMLGAKAMCEKFCSRVVCDPLVEPQWLSCTTLPLRSYFKTQLCPYSTKSLLSYNSRSQGHPSPLKLCCLYHLCYLIWCLKLVSCISKKKLKNTKPSGEWCREETGWMGRRDAEHWAMALVIAAEQRKISFLGTEMATVWLVVTRVQCNSVSKAGHCSPEVVTGGLTLSPVWAASPPRLVFHLPWHALSLLISL